MPRKKVIPSGRKPYGYIMELIWNGYSKEQMYNDLKTNYGYTLSYMRELIEECQRRVERKIDAMAKEIAEKNLNRLEAIIFSATEKGDNKTLLSAIDMENKMLNIYTTNVAVDTKENQTFKIEIGNE